MCNELDQQVHQVAYRSAQGTVDPLAAGVGDDLGRHSRQQPLKGFRAVALQREEVLELVDPPSMIWRLPDAQRRSALDHARRELSFGVAATSAP
jgi:hypothetical protein